MMISGIGKIIIDNMFKPRNNTDGLVRMFEVEYSNEYRHARRAGVQIDRHFVEEFLKSAK